MLLVSIITPVYNRKSDLEIAVNSVLKQTYDNWELIIIDNFSTDGTYEYIKNLNDSRIKVIQIKNFGNIAKSRNAGINISNGNFLCFLDSDDLWAENKLEVCMKYANEGYNFIYHNMYLISNEISKKKKLKYYRQLMNSDPCNDLLLNGPAFSTSSVVLNKETFNIIGNFNENEIYITWEDYDAWLRFFFKNRSFIGLKDTLVYVRINNSNTLQIENRINNIFKIKELYLKNNKFPNWCILSLIKDYFLKKEYSNAIKILNSEKDIARYIFLRKDFKMYLVIIFLYLYKFCYFPFGRSR